MARAATDRIKFNPPLGLMPALQYLLPAQLEIDPAYQRSLDSAPSQTLVRRIAQHWNWDLCQPLVVARRDNGALFVIDGQHRLAAARLRRDIQQLPAVVVQYASPADEAASFVHLNQQRRPLGKIDLFKAALASGDSEAVRIHAALREAGLSIAPHANYIAWKPGMLANIGGIEACWRARGPRVTKLALQAMAEALAGQVLRYAGTIFPGIAAVVDDETGGGKRAFAAARWELFVEMVREGDQDTWRGDIMRARAQNPNLKFSEGSQAVFRQAWAELLAELAADD